MSYGILSGPAIQAAIEQGEISISPYNSKHINPASYDLTLGKHVAVYEGKLDAAMEPKVKRFEIPPEGIELQPGVGYLMHTHERVKTNHYVPVLDGKSSIGRLFIWIHITAGYGDTGFDGQYTLEVVSLMPVRIYAGMRICQIRFNTLVGPVQEYGQNGSYVGALAEGPVPSRAWKMFQKREQ